MFVENIYFDTQEEAVSILNQLKQTINRYGQVTLDNYYKLCEAKVDTPGTDEYGWMSLNTAAIDCYGSTNTPELQFFISFPQVKHLTAGQYVKTEESKAEKLYNCSNCKYCSDRGWIDGPCRDCITTEKPYTQPSKWSPSEVGPNRSAQITRDDILDKAKSIINGERQGTYGSPEDSFKVIANFWSSYLNTELTPHDVANMMILLKIARNAGGVYKDDNWIDICGYAAIGGELQGIHNQGVE